MEFAFLNAILRSPHFPPYDPYFAGGIINYYYFGLYLVSLPIKLTGIASEVAFNLAVPGLFALTAVGLFSVAYNLASGFGEHAGAGGGERGEQGSGEQGSGERGAGSVLPPPLRPGCRGSGGAAGAVDGQFARVGVVAERVEERGERQAASGVRLLGGQPGDPEHHQRVPAVDLRLRRPAPAYDRHAVRAVGGGVGAELGAGRGTGGRDRGQGTGDSRDRRQEKRTGTGDRGQGTGDRGQGRGQGTGDRRQGTGVRGQGTGDGGQGTGVRDRGLRGDWGHAIDRGNHPPPIFCLVVYLSAHRACPWSPRSDQHLGFADLCAVGRRGVHPGGVASAAMARAGRLGGAGRRGDHSGSGGLPAVLHALPGSGRGQRGTVACSLPRLGARGKPDGGVAEDLGLLPLAGSGLCRGGVACTGI